MADTPKPLYENALCGLNDGTPCPYFEWKDDEIGFCGMLMCEIPWYDGYRPICSKQIEQDDLLRITMEWARAVQAYYEGQNRSDLTQVFMKGPFVGWSERSVAELADKFIENGKKWPTGRKSDD